ncbi:hypothetical protein CC_0734 [Caulobacter vibrioides CB15]|uniref:Uncharacterized protein n=1 Tax=Caulobacter vibrioides (strain ATCC 19089 / CIP 103742 / CB 15) TaxID=190650 RepID=Q9AA72_CAUVC|nr:hypothetical protein CC_0734 [Caulobacter vibrioides CB15]AVH77063.1 hypothetical protein CA607_20280 [Caulobacter vibrioides]
MMRHRATAPLQAPEGSIWIPAFAGKVGFLEGCWRLFTTLG